MTPEVPSTPELAGGRYERVEESLMGGKRPVEHFDVTYAGWAA